MNQPTAPSKPAVASARREEPQDGARTDPDLVAYGRGDEALSRKRLTASRAALAGLGFWFLLFGLAAWTDSLGASRATPADLLPFLAFIVAAALLNYAYFRTDLYRLAPLPFRSVTLIMVMTHGLVMLSLAVYDQFSGLTGIGVTVGLLIIHAFMGLSHGFRATLAVGAVLIGLFVLAYASISPGPATLSTMAFSMIVIACSVHTVVMAVVNGLNRQIKYKLVALYRAQHHQTTVIREQKAELDRRARELTQFNETLRHLSLMDELTQVANRRHFDEQLQREWVRSVRQAQHPKSKPLGLGLILVDVDYFKDYNDCFGHVEGDQCLRRVAEAMRRSTLRLNDLTARYGGEEFAVLLPDTPIEGAERVAKRIMDNIDELSVPHPVSDVTDHVTVSVGVAHVTHFDGMQSSDLISLADEALYQAKAQGRNRLMVSTRAKPAQERHLAAVGSS